MKPRILVTGSQGLIGRVLCQALAADYEVFGLDIKASEQPRHYQIDIGNLDELAGVLLAIRPTYLLHFAATTRALNDFDDNLHSNIIGTRNIYVAAVKAGVKRVIYASSNQVVNGYEPECPDGFSIAVNASPRPTTYYACSKLFGEAVARYHFECDGLESICLRIGTLTETDLPPPKSRMSRTWLSHRDLLQLIERSLQAGIGFGVYYAVSDNAARLHDLSGAQRELGYVPLDDGASVGPWTRNIIRVRNGLRRQYSRYSGGGGRGVRFLLEVRQRLLSGFPGHWRANHASGHYGKPARLEQDFPARRDLFRVTVQEGLIIDVFWKSLQYGKGAALSVFVCEEEFMKFDCFGPGKGHYHIALFSPAAIRQGRIRFPESSAAEQIGRTIFELENNFAYYLERAANPAIRRFELQQGKLQEVLPKVEIRMREFLLEVPELGEL